MWRGDETVKLAIIDKPKNLTINKFIQIANAPKQGSKTGIRYIWYRISQDFGNIPAKEASTIVITAGVLESSRKKSAAQQQAMVNELGCEMPKIEDGLLVCFLPHILSVKMPPIRFYSLAAYSRAQEKIDQYTLAFGGFSESGLRVTSSLFDDESFGVGALLKL